MKGNRKPLIMIREEEEESFEIKIVGFENNTSIISPEPICR